MSRDDFEKLANCANNNEPCRNDIFNNTNPYNISSDPGFVLVLKSEYKGDANEAERVKLFYDIICDDSKFAWMCIFFFIFENQFWKIWVKFLLEEYRHILY